MNRILTVAVLWVATSLPAWATVDIQEVKTPDGFNAWLVQEPSIPFAAVEIVFRGGTSLDLPGKRGATYLMSGLLEEGAGDLDAQGFAQARDDLAASVRFDVSDDSLSVSLRFLSETRVDVTKLVAAALSDPSFDEDAVERVRAQVLSGLRSDIEDPDSIASLAFAKATFGDHPYGTAGEGTLESVAALSADDLRDAHQGALARDRVYVGAAGDISPEELAEMIDAIMADLPEIGAPLPGPATLNFDGSTTVLDYPTPQSVIRFAQPGLERDHPDYFAAFVMNQIFGGGGFGSRLMEEVREKRGLTYGISAYLAQKDEADLFVGGASTANARASETVEVVRQEWARMAAEGPTQEELDRAKTYLTGAYPLRFDGNDAIAAIMVGMQLGDLSVDYITTRNAKVEAVTLEDAKRVAAELMDPDALTFLIVGQPEGLSSDN